MLVIGHESDPTGERSQARHAINYCWDEQKRKSLDPATARFVAGACESMEQEYTAKYGQEP